MNAYGDGLTTVYSNCRILNLSSYVNITARNIIAVMSRCTICMEFITPLSRLENILRFA